MHWVRFVILSILLLLVQTTLGRALMFNAAAIGPVGPDLVAVLAAFVALSVRTQSDAVIACWLLGLMVDLATAGGAGSTTVVGPMALAYALGAWILFRVREGFFRDRATTRAVLTLVFCGLSHVLWVTAQSLLAGGGLTWSAYGGLLVQAGAVAAYSAVLAPLIFWGLWRIRKWIMPAPAGRGGRAGR